MTDASADRGLQYERTALAYWRTMLAAAAVGVLILRQSDHGVERVIATIGVTGALLVIAVAGFLREAALHRRGGPARQRSMAGVSAALVVLQVVAVVVVL